MTHQSMGRTDQRTKRGIWGFIEHAGIFTFITNRWESRRFLRVEFGYPCLVRFSANRSDQFFERIPLLRNSTLCSLAAL